MAKTHPRHMSRRLVLQALYQFQMNENGFLELKNQFSQTTLYQYSDGEYFDSLLKNILDNREMLDELIVSHLSRSIDDLDPVEHAVLWIGAYELQHALDIPYKVVINEALELNKTFGSIEGYKFINGVLDALAKQYRQAEMRGQQRS